MEGLIHLLMIVTGVVSVGRNLCSVKDFQEGDWPCLQTDSEDSGDQCGSHHDRRFHGWLGLACLVCLLKVIVLYTGVYKLFWFVCLN